MKIDWTKPVKFTGDPNTKAHLIGMNPYTTSSYKYLVISEFHSMRWVDDEGYTGYSENVVIENVPPPKRKVRVFGVVCTIHGTVLTQSFLSEIARENWLIDWAKPSMSSCRILQRYDVEVEYEDKT